MDKSRGSYKVNAGVRVVVREEGGREGGWVREGRKEGRKY